MVVVVDRDWVGVMSRGKLNGLLRCFDESGF